MKYEAMKLLAVAAGFLAVAAAPPQTPAPTDSSHVIKTPVRATTKAPKLVTKPVFTQSVHPAMSPWRKAYIARTGHNPPAHHATVVAHHPTRPLGKATHKSKRCV